MIEALSEAQWAQFDAEGYVKLGRQLDGATLADFNETAAKMQMDAEINQASITADDITLNVTVGSLIVTGEVRTNDANAADVALQALTSIMTNATEVQSTFGLPLVEVTALPTLSYVANALRHRVAPKA